MCSVFIFTIKKQKKKGKRETFTKTTNKKSYCGYRKIRKLEKNASKFVRKQEELFCKYYCANDMVCQYFLDSIIHGSEEKHIKAVCNYNLEFIAKPLTEFVSDTPNLMDANLLPYDHHNHNHSFLQLTYRDNPTRFLTLFKIFFF